MSEHSPLDGTWATDGTQIYSDPPDRGRIYLAAVKFGHLDWKATAHLIVRDHNAHEKLVEALAAIIDNGLCWDGTQPTIYLARRSYVAMIEGEAQFNAGVEALRLARGEPS